MKLLQMGGYDVACSLAPSQADRTRCKSRQDGGYMSDDEQPTKRDRDQFKKKIARNCVCIVQQCKCISACNTHQ